MSHPNLTRNTLLGLGLGLLLGIAFHQIFPPHQENEWIRGILINGLFHVAGQVFLSGLMLLVVPLVFVSLVCGTAALDDVRKIGRMGIKTLGLYLLTTAIAITIAMIAALWIKPGDGFQAVGDVMNYEAGEAPTLAQILIDLFPRNPIQAMAEGNMLQIIIFAILLGVAMSLAGQSGKRLLNTFDDLNIVIMRLVGILMALAPVGVFALVARTFANQGLDAMGPLLKYFLLVAAVLFIHACTTYPLLLKFLSGLSPWIFLRKMREVQVFAFATASSNATLPVNMRNAGEKLGVHPSVGAFTLPLGATINMDGTAVMQGVATIFISQVYGIELTTGDLLTVILTATLASIGTAGVPGVGLVMLTMVLQQVGLPIEGIALILGIDRLLDMLRTAVNITGDAAVTCIVANSENRIDRNLFNHSDL